MRTKNIVKYGGIYAGDLFAIIASFFVSLIFVGTLGEIMMNGHRLLVFLAAQFVIYNVVFFTVRYYKDSVFNFDSFSAIVLGASLFIVHTLFYLFTIVSELQIGLGTVFISLVFSCFLAGTYRICVISGRRTMLRFAKCTDQEEKRIIIFGAGEAGKFLASMLAFDKCKRMKVVAFVDDNEELHGRKIKGYPVAGGRNCIAVAVKKYRANQIIIAIPHVDNSNFREIVELSCQSGCKVQRFANMSDLNMHDLSKATINDINIEELLGRAPIKLDLKGVQALLENKVVLVTGGAGSIGSEICRQVLSYNAKKIIIFDMHENGLFAIGNELRKKYNGKFETIVGSIKDKARLDEIMKRFKPNIVFHAAAYKHVPMMEHNPIEAVANNVYGTYNTMLSAVEHNVENFTMISTDKAVNPTNIMGATKRITELLCKRMSAKSGKTKFSAVRFGNVLGSNGSVIPIFEEQIRKGGPITVTDPEIKRYFMTIPEAVQLVMEASSISKGGELFVLDMGTMVRIYDLATTMIRLSGLEPEKDIKIIITGLRPGEKMYEELQMDTESLTRTSNDRIFIFKAEYFDVSAFENEFNMLGTAMKKRDLEEIFNSIRVLVPTYRTSEFIHRRYFEQDMSQLQNELQAEGDDRDVELAIDKKEQLALSAS